MGCGNNDASSTTRFGGITQTYVLQGGARKLTLDGRTGTYQASTFSGVNLLPVSLTRRDITVGGVSLPYIATRNLFQASGIMGVASDAISVDPTPVPGHLQHLGGR